MEDPTVAPDVARETAELQIAANTGRAVFRDSAQHKINLIWEYTQASIAAIVVVANILYIFALLFVSNVSVNATTTAGLLANAFFLVIGFYFGRTNHARPGADGSGGGKNES